MKRVYWAFLLVFLTSCQFQNLGAKPDALHNHVLKVSDRSQTGQEAAARTALETVVKARYPAYTAGTLTGTALINEILLQRRIELWGEGFGVLDIKRLHQGLNRPTGAGNHGAPNFNPRLYTLPDGDPQFLMRIPQNELSNNISMTPADQNP